KPNPVVVVVRGVQKIEQVRDGGGGELPWVLGNSAVAEGEIKNGIGVESAAGLQAGNGVGIRLIVAVSIDECVGVVAFRDPAGAARRVGSGGQPAIGKGYGLAAADQRGLLPDGRLTEFRIQVVAEK